jgi:hypothetical protein
MNYERMVVRSTLLFCYILTIIIEENIENIIAINSEYLFVRTINFILIILSNFNLFIFPLIIYLGFNDLIINFFNFIDLLIRSLCFSINCSVLFNPDFCFISFYVWNILLLYLIFSNYYLSTTYPKYNVRKFPGKKIKSKETCSICLSNNSNWVLPCNHQFNSKCIKNWFSYNKSCPICRLEY